MFIVDTYRTREAIERIILVLRFFGLPLCNQLGLISIGVYIPLRRLLAIIALLILYRVAYDLGVIVEEVQELNSDQFTALVDSLEARFGIALQGGIGGFVSWAASYGSFCGLEDGDAGLLD